ncbi:MAG: PilZ domain-containing protein [Myxococcales bacterium]
MELSKADRVPFTGSIEYYCWDQRKLAEAQEISSQGLFLRSNDVLPEGSMVTLRLRLPASPRAFTVLGRVTHVVLGSETRRRGMGIHFLDISPSDRDAVAAYVASRPPLLAA